MGLLGERVTGRNENSGVQDADIDEDDARRQDYERGSTLGKIDPVFPLPFLNLCPGGSRRGLRSKQGTHLYNDAVCSLN